MIRKSKVLSQLNSHLIFLRKIKSGFTSQNIRVPLIEPLTNISTDQHLNRYSEIFSAYLRKRRVTRQQIWPKMYITQGNPAKQLHHLSYQKLFSIKKSLRDSMLARFIKRDPSENINTAFVISVFAEQQFKEMIDQYAKKVLICGKCPQNQLQQEVQANIIDLFRVFYYGEKVIPLERQIELTYLSQKQQKWYRYTLTKTKNAYNKCVWRKQDQRVVEELVNFRSLDMNFSDQNFRPFFEPLNIHNRLPHVRLTRQLMNNFGWYQRMIFKYYIEPEYKKTQSYYRWITQVIILRIYHWTQSQQFTQLMKIPPDYIIQKSIFQIHVWMVIERLRIIDTRQSRYIAAKLTHGFKMQLEVSVGSLNVKRKSLLEKNIANMIDMNSAVLNMHFKNSNITKNNLYLGIDALVWSLAFTQKVERYSDQVYLFSEYIVKIYQHIQRHSEQDILNGIVQFDVFLVDPNYKQKIQKINPPLSSQQFEKEASLDNKVKKYSYNYIQRQAQLPLHSVKASQSKVNISSREIFDSLIRGIRKYSTLQNFDHFNEMDRRKKQMKQKQKTVPWKTEKDKVKQFKSAFEQIQTLKTRRRKFTSNIKKDE